MSTDVYAMLVDDMVNDFGPAYPRMTFEVIVEYLTEKGLLDYDTLKEVYLYGEEE